MLPPFRLRAPVLPLALTTLVVLSCGELPTDPPAEEPAAPAVGTVTASDLGLQSGGPGAPGALSATLRAPVNERETVYGDFGGGGFELPTLVEIRMEGILDRYWAYPDLMGEPAGRFGPGGAWWEWDCRLNVVVLFSDGGGFAPCKGPHHEMQAVYVDTVVVRGVASVRRNLDRTSYWVLRCGPSFGNNCHSYSGSQTVTVTPVADALRVEASESHVEPGAAVTFTASTRDGHPFTVREWTWVPAGPSEDEPTREVVCGTGAECTHTVSTRGTMYVSAVVSGRVEQAGALVSTDEPLFVVEVAEIHSDDGAIYPGTAVRFHARTTDGAPFQLLEWSWVADDEGSGATTACAHTAADCTTAVHESGTMRARAEIGGEEHSDGAHVEVVAARLVLECAPAEVVRGATVSCEASADPAGTPMEVTGWEFRGGGHEVPGPTTGPTWSGPLVTDGEVTVMATIAGRARTASASVGVEPRDWSNLTPEFTVQEDNPGPLRPKPQRVGHLGSVDHRPTQLPLRDYMIEIDQGPNQGLVFMAGIPFAVTATIHINTTALSERSDFWLYQSPRRWTDAAGTIRCGRGDVVPFADVVRAHEGNPPNPRSHTGLFRDHLFLRTGPALEGVVEQGLFDALQTAQGLFGTIVAEARVESARADSPELRPEYCLFRYFEPQG